MLCIITETNLENVLLGTWEDHWIIIAQICVSDSVDPKGSLLISKMDGFTMIREILMKSTDGIRSTGNIVISKSTLLLSTSSVSSLEEGIMNGLAPIIETGMSKDTTEESNIV